MEKEIRSLDLSLSELRANKDSRNIEGYGIVFNSLSKDLGGFQEMILPEAIDGVLDKSDVLALLNHDISKGVLARSKHGKGTLKLSIETTGVKYSFESPNTSLGNEVIEGVRRGDIKTSSFAFNITKDGERWEKRSGKTIRVITKFAEIFDVSMVYHEAYSDTSVALRSLDSFQKTTPPVSKKYANLSDDEWANVSRQQRQKFLQAQSEALKFGHGKKIK